MQLLRCCCKFSVFDIVRNNLSKWNNNNKKSTSVAKRYGFKVDDRNQQCLGKCILSSPSTLVLCTIRMLNYCLSKCNRKIVGLYFQQNIFKSSTYHRRTWLNVRLLPLIRTRFSPSDGTAIHLLCRRFSRANAHSFLNVNR